ncbi:MAG: AAA family ATPase [Sandaracinaceae bacterium]|nr:AAA family ATPase [Sandaracinaceae bacterium]
MPSDSETGPRTFVETGVLHDGARTRVVRALEGTRAVVLKQVRHGWSDPTAVERLRREHDLLRRTDGHGSVRAVGLELRDVPQLVLEDVGAVALRDCLPAAREDGETALRVAVAIAEALAAVHARGVLHRDVNPANLIVHPETGAVWLIDFGLASELATHRARATPVAALEGTPAYLAPEQTGRTNRSVDARSDLYSVGATLYELFSGRVPLHGEDLLGFMHAHLAVEPPRLEPVVEGLPPATIDLVHALLSKAPEARYQSAAGLVIDLRALLEAARGGPEVMELRGRRVRDRPELPQALVGREREARDLEAAFENAREGGRGAVWVTGAPGIGKTSLVHELDRTTAVAGGRVLEGKFDQFSRDVPLSALRSVLEAFAADVLAGSAAQVASWKERLLEATEPNAGLLVDLSPTLGARCWARCRRSSTCLRRKRGAGSRRRSGARSRRSRRRTTCSSCSSTTCSGPTSRRCGSSRRSFAIPIRRTCCSSAPGATTRSGPIIRCPRRSRRWRAPAPA